MSDIFKGITGEMADKSLNTDERTNLRYENANLKSKITRLEQTIDEMCEERRDILKAHQADARVWQSERIRLEAVVDAARNQVQLQRYNTVPSLIAAISALDTTAEKSYADKGGGG